LEKPFPAYRGDQPYVFVSYAHDDAALVYPQLAWLHDQGYHIWYDEGISPGTRWSEELATALQNSAVLLYFGTPNSVGSRHCLDEVNFALDAEKPTIAIHLVKTELTPGLQLRLSSHQAILKSELSDAEFQNKLTSAVGTYMDPAVSLTPPRSDVPPPANRGRAAMLLTGVAMVILAGIAFWWSQPPSEDTTDQPGPAVAEVAAAEDTPTVPAKVAQLDARPAIAVLPFDNLSQSEDNAFFAAGMHDDILSSLSKIKGLRVISRVSVLRAASTDKSLKEIADELGAGNVLNGSVRRAGNKVRISVQLIDTALDENLWSETYDRELEDVFEVQSELARQVTEALKVALEVDVLQRIGQGPTRDMAAYDLYLRGRSLIWEQSSDTFMAGKALIEQALALDPDFGLAHAWLGMSYVIMAQAGVEWRSVREAAFAAAEKAMALAPDEAEPLVTMGSAHFMDRQMTRARRVLDQALARDPDHVLGLTFLSLVSSFIGDLDTSYHTQRRAFAVNPLDPDTNISLAFSLARVGRPAEAVDAVNRAIQIQPTANLHWTASMFYSENGDAYNQLRHLLSAYALDQNDVRHPRFIAQALSWIGEVEAAERWLAIAEKIAPGHESVYAERSGWLADQQRHDERQALIDEWLAHNPDSLSARSHAAQLLEKKASQAWREERYADSRQLNEQAFQMSTAYVDSQRIDGELRPDMVRAWGVMRHASIARALGRDEAFDEALQSLRQLYQHEGRIGWEDYHLMVLYSLAGERELALEHMRRLPDGAVYGVAWFSNWNQIEMYGLEVSLTDDIAFQQVRQQILDDHAKTRSRLRQDMPDLFNPAL
jgi:TolB-like protein/Tfp pilus assembly protein PilF